VIVDAYLGTDLPNSDVKFIKRQANGVVHSLTMEAPYNASFQSFKKRKTSFHIYRNIPHCISCLINNEKL